MKEFKSGDNVITDPLNPLIKLKEIFRECLKCDSTQVFINGGDILMVGKNGAMEFEFQLEPGVLKFVKGWIKSSP